MIGVVAVQLPEAGVVGDEDGDALLLGQNDDGVLAGSGAAVGLDHLESVSVQVYWVIHHRGVLERDGWSLAASGQWWAAETDPGVGRSATVNGDPSESWSALSFGVMRSSDQLRGRVRTCRGRSD